MAGHTDSQSIVAFATRAVTIGHRMLRMHIEILWRFAAHSRIDRSQMCLHSADGKDDYYIIPSIRQILF